MGHPACSMRHPKRWLTATSVQAHAHGQGPSPCPCPSSRPCPCPCPRRIPMPVPKLKAMPIGTPWHHPIHRLSCSNIDRMYKRKLGECQKSCESCKASLLQYPSAHVVPQCCRVCERSLNASMSRAVPPSPSACEPSFHSIRCNTELPWDCKTGCGSSESARLKTRCRSRPSSMLGCGIFFTASSVKRFNRMTAKGLSGTPTHLAS